MTSSTHPEAPSTPPEVRPAHAPVVPIPQDPFLPKARLQRLVNRFPGGQFLRYVSVGVFNTVFGYSTFALLLSLLNHIVPHRFLYLTVIAASVLSTPLNITVAYLGYKFIVFKTRGNYLAEWFRCFGVYGLGMLPGLFALSAVTRLFQSLLTTHAGSVQAVIAHLPGRLALSLEHIASGRAAAGYLAGALVQGFTTFFSFVGHKKVTFKARPQPAS